MSHLVNFAKSELDIIGMKENDPDEMNRAMREHIIHMVEEFSKEGHSGFSASYAIGLLQKILSFEPLSPLTGEDSEWNDVSHGLCQNNRCSHVFKDKERFNGQAYDIEGFIFEEHHINEDGEECTSCFTNSDSAVPITFPYTPKRTYIDVGFRDERDKNKPIHKDYHGVAEPVAMWPEVPTNEKE